MIVERGENDKPTNEIKLWNTILFYILTISMFMQLYIDNLCSNYMYLNPCYNYQN